jgi:hypothetical protein
LLRKKSDTWITTQEIIQKRIFPIQSTFRTRAIHTNKQTDDLFFNTLSFCSIEPQPAEKSFQKLLITLHPCATSKDNNRGAARAQQEKKKKKKKRKKNHLPACEQSKQHFFTSAHITLLFNALTSKF